MLQLVIFVGLIEDGNVKGENFVKCPQGLRGGAAVRHELLPILQNNIHHSEWVAHGQADLDVD